MQKIFLNLYKLQKRLIMQTYESNQSNLRFLVKNTLLNSSHLERFDTVCTPFPMERHKLIKIIKFLLKFVRSHELNQSNLRFLVKNTLLNNSHLERFITVCTPMERHIYKTVLVIINNRKTSLNSCA